MASTKLAELDLHFKNMIIYIHKKWLSWRSVPFGIEPSLVRVSTKELCCILENDTILCSVLVQARKTGKHAVVTEKLLTGT